MNFQNTYYILSIVLLLLACDNSKTLKKVEAFEASAADNNWLIELSKKTPLNSQELVKLLPPKLQGMPLVSSSPEGTQTVVGTYSNETDPNYASTTITFELVDGAGTVGFQHLNAIHKLIHQDVNQSSDVGWVKTSTHKHQKILVAEETDTTKNGMQPTVKSDINMIKNQRFHIKLSGRHLPANQLTRALDEVINLSFPE